jgi:hypothetical protein
MEHQVSSQTNVFWLLENHRAKEMLDEETLRRKIRRLDEAVWERRVPGHSLDDWLNSFSPSNHNGVDERLQMLYLLSNFLYFGVCEIRHLLRVLFGDLCRRPIL